MNNMGPRELPCIIPVVTEAGDEMTHPIFTT